MSKKEYFSTKHRHFTNWTDEECKIIEEAEKDILPGLRDAPSSTKIVESSKMNDKTRTKVTKIRERLVKEGRLTQERFEELEKM